MAIKQKETERKSKLVEVLTTEYKWENLLLGFLSIIAGALSMMLITGNSLLQIDSNFPILGQGNNGIIFAWALFLISVFGLVLFLYPFILPALPELKKITWPTKSKFIDHSIRVILFLIIVTLIIFLYDLVIIKAGLL